MNRTPDVELVLRDYFADDGLTAPDRVLDVVEERIGRRPQRRPWPFPGRTIFMTPIKLAAGLAAAVVVAFVAWQVLPGRGGVGSEPTPEPTATPAPPSPTTTPLARLNVGVLAAGTYAAQPYLSDGEPLQLAVTVPAGWQGMIPEWAVAAPEGLTAPNGLGIAFLRPLEGIFSDPCHWDLAGTKRWPQRPDVLVGPTVDDLVTALGAQTAYTSTAPQAVTVDGYRGMRLDLVFPATLDPTTCDRSIGMQIGTYMPFGKSDAEGSNLYAQGPGQTWHLWVLDVEGTRLVLVVNDYEGTSPATYTAAEGIVESLQLTP